VPYMSKCVPLPWHLEVEVVSRGVGGGVLPHAESGEDSRPKIRGVTSQASFDPLALFSRRKGVGTLPDAKPPSPHGVKRLHRPKGAEGPRRTRVDSGLLQCQWRVCSITSGQFMFSLLWP
jgi:hypothetical protein